LPLESYLLIIFLALAIVKSLLTLIIKRLKPLRQLEEDLTFVLEVLSTLVTEVTKLKEWVRALEVDVYASAHNAAIKKESGS